MGPVWNFGLQKENIIYSEGGYYIHTKYDDIPAGGYHIYMIPKVWYGTFRILEGDYHAIRISEEGYQVYDIAGHHFRIWEGVLHKYRKPEKG